MQYRIREPTESELDAVGRPAPKVQLVVYMLDLAGYLAGYQAA